MFQLRGTFSIAFYAGESRNLQPEELTQTPSFFPIACKFKQLKIFSRSLCKWCGSLQVFPNKNEPGRFGHCARSGIFECMLLIQQYSHDFLIVYFFLDISPSFFICRDVVG